MVHDPAEADDAAQETFLKAFKNLRYFRGDAAFSTWFYRIAYNHCLTLCSRSTRRKDILDVAKRETPVPALKSQEEETLEKAGVLLSALASLPAEYRNVIVLRLEGLNYKEIADVLGVSLDAVKAKLRRARRSLEEKFPFSPTDPQREATADVSPLPRSDSYDTRRN